MYVRKLKKGWCQFFDDQGGGGSGGGAAAPAPVAAAVSGHAAVVPGESGTTTTGTSTFNLPPATNTPGGETQPNEEFMAKVPERFRGFDWVQNAARTADPLGEVLKMYENAQTLIGRRPAGSEAIPDDPAAYTITPVEWQTDEDKKVGAYLGDLRPESFMTEIKKVAKEVGITPSQLQKMAEGYDKAFVTVHKAELAEMQKQQEKWTDEFNKYGQKRHGDKWDGVLTRANDLLRQLGTDEDRAALQALEPGAMAIMADWVEKFRQRYIKEDAFTPAGAATSGKAPAEMSDAERRSSVNALLADPAYGNPTHPGHEAAVQKVNALYATMRQQSARR